MGREEMSVAWEYGCPCGHGIVRCIEYSPDYMYGSVRFEHENTCDDCASTYVLRWGFKRELPRFLLREDVETKRALEDEVARAMQRFRSSVAEPLATQIEQIASVSGSKYTKQFPIISKAFGIQQRSVEWLRRQCGPSGLRVWMSGQISLQNAEFIAAEFGLSIDKRVIQEALDKQDAMYSYVPRCAPLRDLG